MSSHTVDYSHLPEAFKPPVVSNPPHDRDVITAVLPIAKLPRGLTPSRGYNYQPPKFNYGWPYMAEDFIALAKKRGFLVPGSRGINIAASMRRMLELLRDLGVKECTPILDTNYTRPINIISLTSNYKAGNRLPDADEIAKIKDFLDFSDPPMWYLDSQDGFWGRRQVY